ncbi:MAG TPA: 30S ribosomal protein S4 [Limnochordia bacterium]|nr:30S ribosomal protein S4 [Limnochordia bacterium]
MARYIGPVCRLCRREGEKLFLKGEKCYTEKCPFERRGYPPGQHGQGRRQRPTEYGIHLREKQKLRRIYGVLERQFERYYREAARRKGVTGENLLILLESRLDNIVYRLGFAPSRAAARQLVMHGHFTVNGRKVDIPSAQVRPGDVIEVREKSRQIPMIKESVEAATSRGLPAWLELDAEAMRGTVKSLPTRDQIDVQVQEHLIVEHYSR